MKRLILSCLLLLLLVTVTVPVQASIMIQTMVDQRLHVLFDFEHIDPEIYSAIKQDDLFDVSTIPETINDNFERQNLTDAMCNFDPTQEIFDDSRNSMRVECYLTGSDILNFTINRDLRVRTYHVRTNWRKFSVALTHDYSFNFTNYFATPVSQWELINHTLDDKEHPAYYYNSTSRSQVDPSFYFILPEKVTNVHAVEDIITFDAPLSFEETLLDSPFLILAVLIILIITVLLYRRIRK